eukprot:266102-Karenia_brevis.AAC.1
MHHLGLPELKSATALCLSSKIRYMHTHSDIIHPLYLELLGSCDDLPLSSFPSLSRPFWDSPAICSTLYRAAQGQGPTKFTNSRKDSGHYL